MTNAIADSREGERTSVLRPPSLLILNLNRYRTSIRYREQKPKRNREETPTGRMGEIRHRSLNEGETHTNRMSDKRYRGSRRERGIVRDTRPLTSVSHPTPTPLLLILIVGTATVLQASVSRQNLKPQMAPPSIYTLVQKTHSKRRREGGTQAKEGQRAIKAKGPILEEQLAQTPNQERTHLEPL